MRLWSSVPGFREHVRMHILKLRWHSKSQICLIRLSCSVFIKMLVVHFLSANDFWLLLIFMTIINSTQHKVCDEFVLVISLLLFKGISQKMLHLDKYFQQIGSKQNLGKDNCTLAL